MRRSFLLMLSLLLVSAGFCQQPNGENNDFLVEVLNEKQEQAEGVSVELLRVKDSVLQKAAVTDLKGAVLFENIPTGEYFFKVSRVGYQQQVSPLYKFPLEQN